jgi:hypothetical protein
MKIKIAFLLRGYHLININTIGQRANTSKCINNYNFLDKVLGEFIGNIVEPFNNAPDLYDIDYYFITYESKIMNNLIETLKQKIPNMNIKFIRNSNNNTSISTLLQGILWIDNECKINNKKYNRYIIARNDMIYKQNILNWIPEYNNNDTFYYLFNEITNSNYINKFDKNNNYGRISDNLICIDGSLQKYIDIIMKCLQYPNEIEIYSCFHGILHIIYKYYDRMSVKSIIDGIYDTDTQYKSQLSCNPIYYLAGRPYYFSGN